MARLMQKIIAFIVEDIFQGAVSTSTIISSSECKLWLDSSSGVYSCEDITLVIA